MKFIVSVYCPLKKRIQTLQFDTYLQARRSLNSQHFTGFNWSNIKEVSKWKLLEKITDGKIEYIQQLISRNESSNWCFEIAHFERETNHYRKQATISLSI